MRSRKQTTSEAPKTKTSTTCTTCRERHLKCDGPPACSRCKVDSVSCIFVESRRGKRMQLRRVPDPTPQALSPSITPVGNMTEPLLKTSGTVSHPMPESNSTFSTISPLNDPPPQNPTMSPLVPRNSFPTYSASPAVLSPSADSTLRNPSHLHLFNLFCQYFYPSHPFLLPRDPLATRLSEGKLPHLQAAISYIGSSYDNDLTSLRASLRVAVDFTIFVQHPPRDGFLIQTLVLYAIGLHANNERPRASQILNMAIDLALELGLNQRDYALNNNQGSPQVAESWRRTWWELYFIDGMFAAADQKDGFRLSTVPLDCLLPCEETAYSTGLIAPPQSISDYEKRAFSTPAFSSYTYRIDTVRILTGVLRLRFQAFTAVDFSDAQIVNWCLSLPENKKKPVTQNGHGDQLLVQAYMTIYLAAILLHRPRSSLITSNSTISPRSVSKPSLDTHTAKALHAADNMASLTKLAQSAACFSPIFSHSLVDAATIHLCSSLLFATEQIEGYPSMASIPFAAPNRSRLPAHLTLPALAPASASTPSRHQVSQRVHLEVGMLKALGMTWPLALSGIEQIKIIGRDIFLQLQRTQLSPSLVEQSSLDGLMRFLDQDCPAREEPSSYLGYWKDPSGRRGL